MIYINFKDSNGVETMNEYATRAEALVDLKEYRMSQPGGMYYISQRATRAWYAANRNEV